MTEKIKHHEHSKHHEHLVNQEHHEQAEKLRLAAAEEAKKERSELNLAELRKHAKAEAVSKEDHKQSEPHKDAEPDTPIGTQTSLKAHAYVQSLKRIQRHLSKPSRNFSKIVHNRTVDAVSNIGAVTVARPSGLLGGSICAFLGSLVLLYSAKHYGFRYNYLVFFLLFIGGFLLGSMLELLIWTFYSRKQRF